MTTTNEMEHPESLCPPPYSNPTEDGSPVDPPSYEKRELDILLARTPRHRRPWRPQRLPPRCQGPSPKNCWVMHHKVWFRLDEKILQTEGYRNTFEFHCATTGQKGRRKWRKDQGEETKCRECEGFVVVNTCYFCHIGCDTCTIWNSCRRGRWRRPVDRILDRYFSSEREYYSFRYSGGYLSILE